MSYQLRITNPNTNELVISDQSQGLCCVGRATLIKVVQPYGNGAQGGGGAYGGYQIYRLYAPNSNPILFAIDIYQQNVRIMGVSQPAANVWDLTVYATGSASSVGFGIMDQVEVRVWGFSWYNDVLDPKIMTIRDQYGTLKWDFSRRNLLFPRGFGTSPPPAQVNTVSIPVLTNTVVIGTPTGYRQITRFGNKTVDQDHYVNVWSGGNGQIRQSETCIFHSRTGGIDEGQGDNDNSEFSSAPFIVIEGKDLP